MRKSRSKEHVEKRSVSFLIIHIYEEDFEISFWNGGRKKSSRGVLYYS
jgi:hypothetical protein